MIFSNFDLQNAPPKSSKYWLWELLASIWHWFNAAGSNLVGFLPSRAWFFIDLRLLLALFVSGLSMVFANNQGISEGGVYNIMWPSANHHQARFIKHIWPLRALFLRIMTKIQVSEIVKFLLSITLVHRNELCNGVHIYTVVIWYSSICVKGWEMLTAWRPNPEWWGASIVALYTGPPAFKFQN